jgi:pyruvate,water dikinase
VLADDPTPVLEALKFFLSGQAPNPYERQAAAAEERARAMRTALDQRRDPRAKLVRRLAEGAQRFAPLREDALADVGLGWPILRRMLHELGRRLVASDAIDAPADVFWLTLEDAQAAATALDAERAPSDFHAAVAERRAAWERERALTPPPALPIHGGARFMGIDFSGVMPARADQPAGDVLKGVAASPGQVSGPARVIHGPDEFDQMRRGDILVARITTPAWTPLFALAAGVVTDVGGPLSHSSIVAREYHIPAVLGTGAATERLSSGQPIIVDGDAGTVTISGYEGA